MKEDNKFKNCTSLVRDTPHQIAKYYISCLDPNKFQLDYSITPKMIHNHTKELADHIEKLIELKCKETAKNVRHKSVDICTEYFSEEDHPDSSSITGDLMNIQFKDVKPKQ